MAAKRKAAKRPAKKKAIAKARPAKPKPARANATDERRELHYTDLRKVTLANALKRLH